MFKQHLMYRNALLSCSWRPPPSRSPDPLSEGMWGEVPNKSLAPRCSCSRSISPILHPDKPRSLGRYARSDFLMGRSKVLTQGFSMVEGVNARVRNVNLTLSAWWCEIVHEVVEEIGKLDRQETKRIRYSSSLFGKRTYVGGVSPLSEPVLQSTRWTERCARYIAVSSLCVLRTDGTIAGSGQQLE